MEAVLFLVVLYFMAAALVRLFSFLSGKSKRDAEKAEHIRIKNALFQEQEAFRKSKESFESEKEKFNIEKTRLE